MKTKNAMEMEQMSVSIKASILKINLQLLLFIIIYSLFLGWECFCAVDISMFQSNFSECWDLDLCTPSSLQSLIL